MITCIVIIVIILMIFGDDKKKKRSSAASNKADIYQIDKETSVVSTKKKAKSPIAASSALSVDDIVKASFQQLDKDTSVVSTKKKAKSPTAASSALSADDIVKASFQQLDKYTSVVSTKKKAKSPTRALKEKNLSSSSGKEELLISSAQQVAAPPVFCVNEWSDGIEISRFFTNEHWQQLDYIARNDISNHTSNDLIHFLEQHQIRHFYHFTDLSNLPAILQAGAITPGNELKAHQVSWASSKLSHILDKRNVMDLGDYVHLSFCKHHPMLFTARNEKRIATPVVLELDLKLLSYYPFCFTDCNAVSSMSNMGVDKSFLEKNINFGIFKRFYFDLDTVCRAKYQAEIMVKSRINVRFINKIYAVSTIYDHSYQKNIFNFSKSYQRI